MMNLSDETLSILKNFSGINPSLMFKPGQTLRTISPQKTVMAKANVKENFDTAAGVFDLGRFLSTLAMFDEPNINFENERFIISSGKRKAFYTYASENMIITPPDNDIDLTNADVTVNIKWNDLQSVIRAAGIMSLPEIAFIGDGSNIYLVAKDSKNPTADTYKVDVADDTTEPFEMSIKIENMKMMAEDYEVSLSKKGFAHFKSEKVQYWIAVEAKK